MLRITRKNGKRNEWIRPKIEQMWKWALKWKWSEHMVRRTYIKWSITTTLWYLRCAKAQKVASSRNGTTA